MKIERKSEDREPKTEKKQTPSFRLVRNRLKYNMSLLYNELWIPAFAGMTLCKYSRTDCPHLTPQPDFHSKLCRLAGMRVYL